VLVKLTSTVKKMIRVSDSLYRLGGEEFVIIAEDAGQDNAQLLAQKLCGNVEKYDFDIDWKVTISLGVAVIHHGDNVET